MITRVLSAAMLLLAATTASAQRPPHYWGTLSNDDATGVLELDGQLYSVRVGDVLPGHGTIQVVTNEEVVVVQVLSNAEKIALAEQGKAVIDARHMHLRNVQRLLQMPQPIR